MKSDTIIEKSETQLKEKQFYRISTINCKSYSDVMAEWIYNMPVDKQIDLLLYNSNMVKTEKWTDSPIHSELAKIVINDTNRHEENIAKRIMQIKYFLRL
ncbi:hypothetical protein [Butyrivibrio sp. AC2005]|uniref:hypothetical protein n=1 Tax=Butyrivibrio sp. AC2005 TaxID=1280672 RepID=UPI00047DA97A|nr:hypothetical protein [Butyrivibrio sp. AC2005]